uniref:Arylamine N-acetyltransferase 2 n=1 Tax=Tetrahymena thermophila TaxID=5911 RepID=D8FSY5_TETTH|nr:TPA: arylamine N-acetyltransferase 2 [Tetrahymena thermophila]
MINSTQFKLSEPETDQFLKTIQLNKYQEGQCRLGYLKQAMEKTQELIPFQNLFLLATPFEERRYLSYNEIKELVLTGKGGYCLVMNPVFCGFLQSLGYEAYLIHGSCRRIPENHSSILVRNLLEDGDRYLVDVCLGYKNMPLKIDFEQKSELQCYSFASYYYEWEDETKQVLNRIDLHSTFFCCFTFQVFKDYEDMLAYQGDVYTNINKSPYHTSFRMIRFPPSGAVCFRDNELLVEDPTTKKLVVKDLIKNQDQYLRYIEEYFPMVDKQIALNAYKNFFELNNSNLIKK